MGNSLATLSIAAALSVGNTQAEGLKSPDFSGLIESGNPAVTQVVHDTQARIAPLAEETSILLAQASQETDGKVYTVYVIQIDGSKKEVRYTKKPNGRIIPPETTDGKLLDGSPATDNPRLNIGKNISILSKYDKESQLMYALVDKNDVVRNAQKSLQEFISLVETGKNISRIDIGESLYHAYILNNTSSTKTMQDTIKAIEIIATKKVGLSSSDIEKMRIEAKQRADTIWRSVTGALG